MCLLAIVSGDLPHNSPYRVGQIVEVQRVRPSGAINENMVPHGGWLQGTVVEAEGHQVCRSCVGGMILLCDHFDVCYGLYGVLDCYRQVCVQYGGHNLWYHAARDTGGLLGADDGPTLRPGHIIIPDHFVDARLDNGKWVEARVV